MNKRQFLKGMVATAAGLVVPAHVLAESKYEFHQRVAGLKPAGAAGPSLPVSSDGGVDWYGEVPASALITGDALAAAIGLTAGTPQYSDADWLHVGLDGTELLIAKRPLRHSISWNHINTPMWSVGLGQPHIRIDASKLTITFIALLHDRWQAIRLQQVNRFIGAA